MEGFGIIKSRSGITTCLLRSGLQDAVVALVQPSGGQRWQTREDRGLEASLPRPPCAVPITSSPPPLRLPAHCYTAKHGREQSDSPRSHRGTDPSAGHLVPGWERRGKSGWINTHESGGAAREVVHPGLLGWKDCFCFWSGHETMKCSCRLRRDWKEHLMSKTWRQQTLFFNAMAAAVILDPLRLILKRNTSSGSWQWGCCSHCLWQGVTFSESGVGWGGIWALEQA